MAEPLAGRLAAYARTLSYGDLDGATVERVNDRLVDSLACAYAGVDEHGIAADDVERIENETYEAGVSIIVDDEKWRPRTRETADHSLPYCVARAFLDGEMTLARFREEKLTEDAVRALMDRVEVAENPAYTEQYGESFPHRMVVHAAERSYEHEVRYPRGHCENPLTDAELAAKFETGAAGHLDADGRAAVLSTVRDLEAVEDVSALFARL